MHGVKRIDWNGLFKLFVMKHHPIFITGAGRSGSSLVARIISMSGGCFTGYMNGMYENWRLKKFLRNIPLSLEKHPPYPEVLNIPGKFKDNVLSVMTQQGYKNNRPWMFKESLLTPTWKMWDNAFPDAQWIIVYRDPKDIINSCMKTTYMTLMKDPVILNTIGVSTPEAGWEWWIKKHKESWMEMVGSGIDCKIVRPDKMAAGDYSQMKEMMEWLRLPWNEKTIETINPLISRRK